MKKKEILNRAKLRKASYSALHSQTKEQKPPQPVPSNTKKPKPAPTDEKEHFADWESPGWKEQYEALNNKYLFLMAEYANYKKNSIKQMESLRKYEGQYLIHKLLTVVMDDFDRAMERELTEQNISDFKKGILMIYNNLKNTLQKLGVKEAGDKGELFDPNIHNALDAVSNKEIPPDHIVHIVKKAYFFHDKLIRPAEVIVSRKSTVTEKNQDGNE